MKRSVSSILALLITVGTVLVTAPQAGAAPYCGIVWGSLPAGDPTLSSAELVDVRAGRHACFDRLVIDFTGDIDGYDVRYVDQVTSDGSGHRVPVAGAARLQVVATANASPTDAIFVGAGADLVDVRGWRTFRQVVWVSSFEGYSNLGLGVRARLPFRVFLLDGPGDGSRMVVDVAHRW